MRFSPIFIKIVCFILLFYFFYSPKIFAATKESESSTEKIFNEQVDSIVVIGAMDKKQSRLGSGFIVDEDGLIVTNAHLTGGAKKIVIKLHKSAVYHQASLVAIDRAKDIAILKVDLPNLKPVKLGNSNKVQIGERVVSIGNPLGLESTISDGLISSWRTVKGGLKVLQISVPLSQGSSGGPLFNLKGEVIGVTMGSYLKGQNLNFAVPINDVKPLLSKSNLNRLRSALAQGKNVYTVQSKDTLYKIARRFHTTVLELMKLNGLHDTRIRRGQKIKIPSLAP